MSKQLGKYTVMVDDNYLCLLNTRLPTGSSLDAGS